MATPMDVARIKSRVTLYNVYFPSGALYVDDMFGARFDRKQAASIAETIHGSFIPAL